MKKIFIFISLFSLLTVFYSCKKDNSNNNPGPGNNLGGPSIILAPATASGIAGDLVKIGYTTAAPYGISKFHIEEHYDSTIVKILKDSSPVKHNLADDEVLNYRIPDSASAGQQSVIIFKVTDTKGNIATKAATISILASRPRISVTQNKTSAAKGDSVMFTIVMKSTENNLGTLTIGQSINGSSYGTIATLNYTNQSLINTTWYYKIPFTTSSGDHISLQFNITNKAGVVNFVNESVDVK
jgi:hypothetical protein